MAIARSGINRAEHSQILVLAALLLLLLLPTAVFFVFLAVEVTLAVALVDRDREVRVDDFFVADACDLVVTIIVGQSNAGDWDNAMLRCNEQRYSERWPTS